MSQRDTATETELVPLVVNGVVIDYRPKDGKRDTSPLMPSPVFNGVDEEGAIFEDSKPSHATSEPEDDDEDEEVEVTGNRRGSFPLLPYSAYDPSED